MDRKVSIATGVNLLQLAAVIWFGSAFYTQTNERFSMISEQRKAQGDQMVSMQAAQLELQKAQNQMLVQISTMNERFNSQNEIVKEIRDSLKHK